MQSPSCYTFKFLVVHSMNRIWDWTELWLDARQLFLCFYESHLQGEPESVISPRNMFPTYLFLKCKMWALPFHKKTSVVQWQIWWQCSQKWTKGLHRVYGQHLSFIQTAAVQPKVYAKKSQKVFTMPETPCSMSTTLLMKTFFVAPRLRAY